MSTGDPICKTHGMIPCNCKDWFDFTIVPQYEHIIPTQPALQTELEFRDGVVERLTKALEDYLEFETPRHLIKLIGDLL